MDPDKLKLHTTISSDIETEMRQNAVNCMDTDTTLAERNRIIDLVILFHNTDTTAEMLNMATLGISVILGITPLRLRERVLKEVIRKAELNISVRDKELAELTGEG